MSNLLKGEITNGVAELNFEEQVDNEFPTTVFLNGVVDKTFFGEEYPEGEAVDQGDVGDKITVIIGNKVKKINRLATTSFTLSNDPDIKMPLGIPDGVTSIGEFAFYDTSSLTGSLVIPDSVTSIGVSAFSGCSGFTGSLVIPDSVTSIGASAFGICSGFTGTLTLPSNIETIESLTFYQCRQFTGTLNIPDSVTYIGNSAFAGCWEFTGTLNIPPSVTLIDQYAFAGCSKIVGLTLPSTGSLELGFAAFSSTGLSGALSLTGNISKVDRGAFNSTSITSFNIDSNLDISAVLGIASFQGANNCTSFNVDAANTTLKSINGVLFSEDESILIRYPVGKTDTSYTIPNSVTTIDKGAFELGISTPETLTNITLPTNLNIIGYGAFSLSGITANNLVIPNTVTSIGSTAFWNCHNLTGFITIPNSVTSIGDYAFNRLLNISGFNCYIDKSIIDAAGANLFAGSSTWPTVFTIHARSSDSSWTAGSNQTIGGRSGVTVIKDL